MALASPTKLSDEEKLETLRRLDQFRQWRSLDEKRYCLVCGKIITGRQVRVMGGTRGNGPLRISCPTERCNSIPMDWVLPSDEIMANVAIGETAPSEVSIVHFGRDAGKIQSRRLRKLAGQFSNHLK